MIESGIVVGALVVFSIYLYSQIGGEVDSLGSFIECIIGGLLIASVLFPLVGIPIFALIEFIESL